MKVAERRQGEIHRRKNKTKGTFKYLYFSVIATSLKCGNPYTCSIDVDSTASPECTNK